MSKYLYKYVKKYRVLSDYDRITNDYPRDGSGRVEDTFDDFYIACRDGIKIIHNEGNVLFALIPSVKKGTAIAKQLCYKTIASGDEDLDGIGIEGLTQMLLDNEVLVKVEMLNEVLLYFKDKLTDTMCDVCGAKTAGKDIFPLSPKNLPKQEYEIPMADAEAYTSAIVDYMSRHDIDSKDNMGLANAVRKINSNFDEKIIKFKGKKFDILVEQRKSRLTKRQFIHYLGLWEEYLKFITEN